MMRFLRVIRNIRFYNRHQRPVLIWNPTLYPDHTRNGVKCCTKTFCPAWFTPFLVWSIIQNSKYIGYIGDIYH